MGEGKRQRYRIPCVHDGSDVRSRTKKGWRVGQKEQWMEIWDGSEEREAQRMLEVPTNDSRCEDVKNGGKDAALN